MRLSDRQRELAEQFINHDRELTFFSRRDESVIPLSRINTLSEQRLRELQSEIASMIISIEARVEHVNRMIQSGRDVEDSRAIRYRLRVLQRFQGEIRRCLTRIAGVDLPPGLSVTELTHDSGFILSKVNDDWRVITRLGNALPELHATWREAWLQLKTIRESQQNQKD